MQRAELAAPASAGAARIACRTALTCLTGALLLAATTTREATRDKPPTAVTGGFGEATCQMCHSEADVNTGGGGLLLEGVPQGYTPGERYTLTISVTHKDLKAAGFEIAARFEQGGAQAGTLTPHPDHKDRAGVTPEVNIQYAHHLLAGTDPVSPDTARWQLIWDAPLTGGTVVFHAVGNAANADNSPLGDYVYARSATASAAASSTERTDNGFIHRGGR